VSTTADQLSFRHPAAIDKIRVIRAIRIIRTLIPSFCSTGSGWRTLQAQRVEAHAQSFLRAMNSFHDRRTVIW
jgi:hypothetical protein